MLEIKETGGARIGMANATWPLAKLIVDKDKLELRASLVGNLIFRPSDIISIQAYKGWGQQGIQIFHNVDTYNSKVIFWSKGSTELLIRQIEQTGFLSKINPGNPNLEQEIIAAQTAGGFPIRRSAAITIVVVWNILFLYDFIKIFNSSSHVVVLGIGIHLALAFVFCTCFATLISGPFRQLILKPGHAVNNIKSGLYFVMFITGMMFLISTFIPH